MNTLSRERSNAGSNYLLVKYLFVGSLYVLALVGFNVTMWEASNSSVLWLLVGTGLSLGHVTFLVRMARTKELVDMCLAIGVLALQFMVIVLYLHQIPNFTASLCVAGLLIWLCRVHLQRIVHNTQEQAQRQYVGGQSQGQTLLFPECQPGAVRAEFRFPAKVSEKTFDDIHGMSELKARLKKAASCIVNPAPGPDGKTKPRNGILLNGEPGNGKTEFVRALAGELGLPFITVTYGDVASKWVNDTTENVVRAFREAAAQAPCLLFFDEIDSLIPDTSGPSTGESETAKTVNTILTELVDLRDKGVVIVGATNHLDKLDKRAIREGRFDFKVEVTPPDEFARYGILLDALNRNLPEVSYDMDSVRSTSKRWEGYSVSRILAVSEELAAMHLENNLSSIGVTELMNALRRVQGRKGKIPASTKSHSELVLPESLRRQVQTVALRMKDIERVEKRGGTVPSGLLFFGEPGTGKTETARAIAKETGWAFLSTSGNDLISSPSEIDRILAEAKDIRPCIVFIDEADDVLANRKMSNVTSVTNKLLAAMDGAEGKVRDIVFVAATNHPDHIDPAALRGGRFTEKLFFPLPDQQGMEQFVTEWIERSLATFGASASPQRISAVIGDDVSIANAAAILQEAVNIVIGRTIDQDEAAVEIRDVAEAKTVILGE